MPQFFVPKKNFQKNHFYFDPQESRHLIIVLRKNIGDSVQIFDGEGQVYYGKITALSGGRVEGTIESSRVLETPLRKIFVYPSLIKGPAFEWMLEKLTELGVYQIQPFTSQRTVIRNKENIKDSKLKRWEKILLSSAKQCGRSTLPQIKAPQSLQECLKQSQGQGLLLFFWEGENTRELRDIAPKLKEDPTLSIHLFIGPEGGFTVEEVHNAQKQGALSLRLGGTILRAETAAIAATAALLLT